MDYAIKVKKLGSIWYLDIDHLNPLDIQFNSKICKVFNLCDVYNAGELIINLVEVHSIVYDNTIFINDDDLLEYFTTDNSFNVRFMVRDHEFEISSEMYSLIEADINPNFHKTYYRIEIFN